MRVTSMRRRSGLFIRLHEEERGAVLVIVAVTMICLLGMAVLTFDLGHGVALKRNVVNAADSAAIAAARDCGLGTPYGQAQQSARTLIERNNGEATLTFFEADPVLCNGALPPGTTINPSAVKVQATVQQEYYFAQIFGFTSGPVRANATALWGPAIGVTNPIPLRLPSTSAGTVASVDKCMSHEVGYVGPDCAFGFDNSGTNGPASNWGILDFPEGWPTAPPNPMACSSQSGGANDVIDYLSGNVGDFMPVMWTSPVFVCAEGGLSATTINWMIDWLIQHVGQSLIWPVMGPQPPVTTPGGQAWPVIGFASLSVMGAWRGQQARQNCTFPPGVNNASLFCVQLRRDGVQVVDGVPGTGAYYSNLIAIRLVD